MTLSFYTIIWTLSSDKKKLLNLHKNLRKKMEESPLMNGKLYMECVEKEYSRIYQEYFNKENRRNHKEVW